MLTGRGHSFAMATAAAALELGQVAVQMVTMVFS